MRYPPRYPEFPEDKPINWKKLLKWLFIFIGISLFIFNIISVNINIKNKHHLLIFSFLFPIIVFSFFILIYLFLKALDNYNNNLFKEAFHEDNKKWWKYYSSSIPIKSSIIIGTLGDNQYQWAGILESRPIAPLPVNFNNEQRIPCSLLIGDKKNREEMLAKLLVNKFIESEEDNITKIKIDNIYWLGSHNGLNTFIENLKKYNISAPLNIRFINSIDDLDIIIDNYYIFNNTDNYAIVGGSNIYDNTIDSILGETGFLWILIFDKNAYRLHRCEILNDEADANTLAEQVMHYADIKGSPINSLSINHDASREFLTTPLYSAENILQEYFGDSSKSSPFIAISFTALYCITNKVNSCGWISGYDNNQYIAGVMCKNENKQ